MFKAKKLAGAYASSSNRLLSPRLLIGGLIASQVCLASFPAQAAITWSDTIEGNCGWKRPYTKAGTHWSGASSTTEGSAHAKLLKDYGGNWIVEISTYSGRVQGAQKSAEADAGVAFGSGKFRGEAQHMTSFYLSEHYTRTSNPFSYECR